MNFKAAVARGTAAVLLTVGGTWLAGTTLVGSSAGARGDSVTTSTAGIPPIGELSTKTLESLKTYGTQLTVLDASLENPKINAIQATKLAESAFGFTVRHTPSELALGQLTVPGYGPRDSDSANGVDPIISDRTVWFVVFDDVKQRASGPVGPDGESASKDHAVVQGLWVAVDATSGEVLGGESVG
jgi:hypothetical protein